MRKIASLLILKVVAVIAANVAFVWAIVEFILYLAKDKVFNWMSVWLFIGSVVVALGCVVVGFVIASNERIARKQMRSESPRKSKFQQRLEDAMQKAKKST